MTEREKAAQARPPSVDVTLPAHIQARQIVIVRAEFDGTVAEMPVELGQDVYEGQVMARITNQGLEAAHEGARAAAESAQSRVTKTESAIIAARMEASRARATAQRSEQDLERADKLYRRQKFLYGEGATPRLVYEKSEKEQQNARLEFTSLDTLAKHAEERVDALLAELQNAKKILEDRNRELENAQANLKNGEVVAPVEGTVVARRSEPGKTLEPQNRELFEIAVNPSALEAVVDAEPSALSRLRPGQGALLFFADMPDEGVPGTVRDIRGNQAFIDFTSPDPLTIKHGGTAQVRLRLE